MKSMNFLGFSRHCLNPFFNLTVKIFFDKPFPLSFNQRESCCNVKDFIFTRFPNILLNFYLKKQIFKFFSSLKHREN